MHVRWALPVILLLCAAPAADAQLPYATVIEIRLGIPIDPVDPGTSLSADVTAQRVCPTPLAVLAEQDLHLFLELAGPRGEQPVAAMHFPQHVCATGTQQDGRAQFDFVVPLDVARGEVLPGAVTFVPGELEATEIGAQGEQTASFALPITPAPPAPAVVEEPEKESPGLGGIGALLALAAVAVALRRRS